MAAGVLDGPGLGDPALLNQGADLQIELRHDRVGAADAADGSGGETGEQLLIRAVEDDGALIPPHFNALHGHGGVFDADDPGIFQHFPQQGGAQGHAGQLGDVVDDEIAVGRRVGNVVPVFCDAVGGRWK